MIEREKLLLMKRFEKHGHEEWIPLGLFLNSCREGVYCAFRSAQRIG